ncbi:suppressor of lurcher protein 1-like isoform X2 [Limulus polyphemus]|uniref:Suppressor of lurcher protein 1-like isoform X2 n=1 Tax=Limulus polyphemus TaxID=6850 RepID=A0ABM1STV7_LIMPO|nr:suppressor of lurcher protein 1-like isoform X2 [Limulus polyphemus]
MGTRRKKIMSQPVLFLTELLSLLSSHCIFVAAVSADCKCIVFDSTYGKEYGVFKSPNWPVPYEDNINCLLYTFISEQNYLIKLVFDEFDLGKSNLRCKYGDYVKLYLHLKEPLVNQNTSHNTFLCGKLSDIQQTHYSSGSALIFEFHTDWRHENNTGFRGTFRFLNKTLFQTVGEHQNGTKCDYKFISEKINQSKGRFFSPQYPSTYPKDVECSYQFIGRQNERVKIIFEQVHLQKSDLSCLNDPDNIEIHDGDSAESPVIEHLCNINTFVETVSTGPELYIVFRSQSHFPSQGFKATFQFEDDSTFGGDTETPLMDRRKLYQEITTAGPTPPCIQTIDSDNSKNGTFTSSNYSGPYPVNIHCVYHFTGRGRERVQILFTDFDLYLPSDEAKDCEGPIDAVMVFITINGQKERLNNFCGNNLPPQLMSNGPSMTVEFKSYQTPSNVKGFRAIYRFVTNFGITAGVQDPQQVCGFIFNSTVRTNGTFTSPNYPGLYPRATECHYFFYGKGSERLTLTFAYFDVEGVSPCTTDLASDFVEFSNFRTVDRKIPRHCGGKKPKIIESDGDFFRVAFKSNGKFDGTGFEAFYQFRNYVDPLTVKRISGVASLNPWKVSTLSPLLLITLWLMVL